MYHAPFGCRFDLRGYHNVQARAVRMAVVVGKEDRRARMVAARMAVVGGTED